MESPRLITGTGWTPISVTWTAGLVTMRQEGAVEPLVTQRYNESSGLLGVDPGAFHYYSIMGESGLWSFPFCETGT